MAGGQWWVTLVGQGLVNQILGALGGQPLAQQATVATVVQSARKPANFYKGPYATQALALAQAKAYNAPGAVQEAQAAANVGQASGSGAPASSVLGLPVLRNLRDFTIRAVKVILGAVLIIVGVNSLLHHEGIDLPKAVPVPV